MTNGTVVLAVLLVISLSFSIFLCVYHLWTKKWYRDTKTSTGVSQVGNEEHVSKQMDGKPSEVITKQNEAYGQIILH